MPTIQRSDAVATVTTNANILSGTQFEFMPYHGNVAIGISASATGGLMSVYAGSDLVTFELAPVVKSTSPVNPDDFTINFDAYEGTRLVIVLRNPTGGTITFLTTIIITAL